MRTKFVFGVVTYACLLPWLLQAQMAAPQLSDPAPGTLEFYKANVEDRYTLRNGKLVSVENARPDHSIPIPGVIRARAAACSLLDGSVSQILDGSNIVIVTKYPRPSGVPKHDAHIVRVPDSGTMSVADEVRLCTMRSEYYTCVTEGGVTKRLPGHRLVPTVTFEEYLRVYAAESAEPLPGRVVSFERSAPGVRRAPRVIRPNSSSSGAPSLPNTSTNRTPQTGRSYAERRRQRLEEMRERAAKTRSTSDANRKKRLEQYQMDLIRQGITPLPIPLTKEMDDQLVKEGFLPPTEGQPQGIIQCKQTNDVQDVPEGDSTKTTPEG